MAKDEYASFSCLITFPHTMRDCPGSFFSNLSEEDQRKLMQAMRNQWAVDSLNSQTSRRTSASPKKVTGDKPKRTRTSSPKIPKKVLALLDALFEANKKELTS